MAARITAYLVALIVGVTVIAGLIVGATRDDDGPVDLIVVNGNVYTADGDAAMAEAVAVQGNKILLVGSNREVQRLRRPQTVVVDAKGGAVLPGFNDAVADFIGSDFPLQHVNLADDATMTSIESAVKAWAARNPDAEWVLGRGWSLDALDDVKPTRQRLDELVPDRPALLVSLDGQSAWANSMALARARIGRRTENPAEGAIVRESKTGQPTGLLTGRAIELVTDLLPTPTRDERLEALRAAIDDAHRRGVTSVQDLNATVDELDLYDELRREQELDLRVYAAVRAQNSLTDADLDELDELRAKYPDDPVFKTGAVSIVADEDTSHHLRELVADLDERGWQVIIQAIGEGAVQIAKDAVDYARGRNQAPERDRRHRVEATPAVGEQPVQGVQLAARERRTLRQAVDAYTKDAAWASFDEHRKGTLDRDMLADLVILTHDIFSTTPEQPVDTEVAFTIFDGRIVYSRSTDTNE